MAINALIFDCDGTLCDSMQAHFVCWRDALAPYGMQLESENFFRHSGTPSSTVIPMLAEQQGVTIDFEAALQLKEEMFLKSVDLLGPVEPVVQIAKDNRDKKPMAVASGGTRALVNLQLEHLNIIDWFQAIVTCEDTERHKPDPDVFLEAARRLGVPPAECVVYEDGEPGIVAARAAGMQCVDIREMI